jgi:hypothetical protein
MDAPRPRDSTAKEDRPIRKIELTEQTRQSVDEYIKAAHKKPGQFCYPDDEGGTEHDHTAVRTLVSGRITGIGLDPLVSVLIRCDGHGYDHLPARRQSASGPAIARTFEN